MTKNIFKKVIYNIISCNISLPLISHAENKLFANTYEESEILREKSNAAPSTLVRKFFKSFKYYEKPL